VLELLESPLELLEESLLELLEESLLELLEESLLELLEESLLELLEESLLELLEESLLELLEESLLELLEGDAEELEGDALLKTILPAACWQTVASASQAPFTSFHPPHMTFPSAGEKQELPRSIVLFSLLHPMTYIGINFDLPRS
jgi:hypothetical protein